MNSEQYANSFDEYYAAVYDRWRLYNEKAPKDIVGEEYEKLRTSLYRSLNLNVVEDKKRKRIAGYDADLAIEKDGKIIIVEEAKGHYVDSCFLQRALVSCAKVVNHSLEGGGEPPYFVLSCPTRMKNFEPAFNEIIRLFKPDIAASMKEKFLYFPLCKHGRIPKESYYQSVNNCFALDEGLINKEIAFMEKLKNG